MVGEGITILVKSYTVMMVSLASVHVTFSPCSILASHILAHAEGDRWHGRTKWSSNSDFQFWWCHYPKQHHDKQRIDYVFGIFSNEICPANSELYQGSLLWSGFLPVLDPSQTLSRYRIWRVHSWGWLHVCKCFPASHVERGSLYLELPHTCVNTHTHICTDEYYT